MKFGQKVRDSRKKGGLTSQKLAELVGMSGPWISKVEADSFDFGPRADLVVALAEALNDESILHTYLENNPVYQAVVPRVFPELNNIKTDPVAVFTKMEEEIGEASESIKILKNMYGHVNPREVVPKFSEILVANMEQLIDVQRIIEAVQTEMQKEGLMLREERAEVYRRQQQKCLDRQYHKLELEVV